MTVFLIFRNRQIYRIVFIVLLKDTKFSEFLCIPDCLTRMLYFKFQAVFEKKTEECASCSAINENNRLSWKI